MRIDPSLWAAMVLAVAAFPAMPVAAQDVERGRLLYETACNFCHSTQPHWREKRIVRSWDDLIAQVTRWQKQAGQKWTRDEIEAVANYLNQRYYKLQSTPVAGGSAPVARIDTVNR